MWTLTNPFKSHLNNTPRCFSSASPAGPASPGRCTDVPLALPQQQQTCESRDHFHAGESVVFASHLLLHSLTYWLLFSFSLSKKSTKFFCTIESMILLISLAMVDSAYLLLRCCSFSLRRTQKLKITRKDL